MSNDVVLKLLKMDLGITHSVRDEFFSSLLEGAKVEIARKGITLHMDSIDDQVLVSDYAAWSYRKRQEDVPLANNIQLRLRNRIVKERSGVTNATP